MDVLRRGGALLILALPGAALGQDRDAAQDADRQPAVAEWIEALGADDFHVRETATRTLIALGEPARNAIAEAGRHPDPEIRWRARHILAEIEPKHLSGTWEVVSAESDGRSFSSTVGARITFEGPRQVYRHNDSTIELVYVLDPKSRTIDWQHSRGIYEIEGDRLRWCYASHDAERPTEFLTQPRDGRTLVVLQKVRGGER